MDGALLWCERVLLREHKASEVSFFPDPVSRHGHTLYVSHSFSSLVADRLTKDIVWLSLRFSVSYQL